jgi:hypothetical protein
MAQPHNMTRAYDMGAGRARRGIARARFSGKHVSFGSMPRFRVSFVDRNGSVKVENTAGPTAHWVSQHYQSLGARRVSVTEDLLAPDGRDLAREAAYHRNLQPSAIETQAPSGSSTTLAAFIDERLGQRLPKKRTTPTSAARSWAWLAAMFATVACLQRPAHGHAPTLAFKVDVILAVLMLLWGALAVTPLWLDGRVRHARAWRNWPAVLRLTAVAAWHPFIRRRPALRYGFGTLRAAALAGKGRIDEAAALIERVSRDNGHCQAQIDMAIANAYFAANRYDEGIALRRRATRDPTRLHMNIDLAVALLEYKGDVAGAREHLARVDTPPASLLEAAFRSLAAGLLDIEEGRPADAVLALKRTRRAFEQEVPPSALEGPMLWTAPFLCLALAQSGDRDEARALLPTVATYAKATSQPAWFERCQKALADAPVATSRPS